MVANIRYSSIFRLTILVLLLNYTVAISGIGEVNTLDSKRSHSIPAALGIAFSIGALVGIGGYSIQCGLQGKEWKCDEAANAFVYGGATSMVFGCIGILGSVSKTADVLGTCLDIADKTTAGGITDALVQEINKYFNAGDYICTRPPSFWISAVLIGSSFQNPGVLLIQNSVMPSMAPILNKIDTAIERTAPTMPTSDLSLKFDFPNDYSKPYKGDIFLSVSLNTFEDPALIEYAEFEYSTDKLTWKSALGYYNNICYPGKDYTGIDGWCLYFGSSQEYNNLPNGSKVWFRARVKEKSGKYGQWAITPAAIEIINRYDHDYAVKNIKTDKVNVIENDMIHFFADVINEGSCDESRNQEVKLYIDGNVYNAYPNLPAIKSTDMEQVSFLWKAIRGIHNIKIASGLIGDQNNMNNIDEFAINVGVKGNLVIDGTTAPVKEHVLPAGGSVNVELVLQNTGSEIIDITVTKSGTEEPFIYLANSNVSLKENETKLYNLSIKLSANVATGDSYEGIIRFQYGTEHVDVLLKLSVIDVQNGNFSNLLESSIVSIDGGSESSTLTWFIDPSLYWFDLDNYSSTSAATNITLKVDLTEDQYIRMNDASFYLNVNEREGNASTRVSISQASENGYQVFSTSQNGVTIPIISWWRPGSNIVKLSLDNYTSNANNVIWRVYDAHWYKSFSKSAWAKNLTISQKMVDQWRAGLKSARVYFKVSNVTKQGTISLFNLGKEVATRTVSTSDNGKRLYFSLSSSEFATSNFFMIKGALNDATKLTISEIMFEVQYYVGDPLIVAEKYFSNNISLDNPFDINIKIKNNGSNIADKIKYVDELLKGFTLVGGSTSGNIDDLKPGDSTMISYRLRADTVGTFVLPQVMISYNSGNKTYSSGSVAIPLTIEGGKIDIQLQPDKKLYDIKDSMTISATVKSELHGTFLRDASVECVILMPPNQDSLLFKLNSSPIQGDYNRKIKVPERIGEYSLLGKATAKYYTPSLSKEVIKISVQNTAIPPTIINDSIIALTDSSVSVVCRINTNNYLTYWGLRYGVNEVFSNYSPNRTLPEHLSNIVDSITIQGLRDGTRYYMAVNAENRGGQSVSKVRQFMTTLLPPQNVKAVVTNQSSVRLSWESKNRWALGYKIQRKRNDIEGKYESIQDVKYDVLEYTDTTVIKNGNYSYKVVAFTKDTVSIPSTECSVKVITIVNNKSVIPEKFDLTNNYPNPFNPSTKIRFDIPTTCRVKICIYNVLGELVENLLNSVEPGGSYNIEWRPNSPSGIYFFQIQAVELSNPHRKFIEMKKMVLLK